MASQQQVREAITNQIVAALESGGVPPWRRPWQVGPNAGLPSNIVSKKSYRGINPLLLELACERHGLSSRWWGTFNQWKGLGGKVMPRPPHIPSGKWGTQIVFWSPVVKTVENAHGDEQEDSFYVLRQYTVFNIDQVEAVALDHLRAGHGENDTDGAIIDYRPAEETIEAASNGMGVGLRYGGERAFYNPAHDYIQVPSKSSFDGQAEFYATVIHELVHATEHPSRLDWSRKDKDNTYALGELVAELGGVFLSRELGVPASEDMSNHVAYLANWLQAMKSDTRFIFTAASLASRAADYLLAFSRPQVVEEAEPEMALAG